MTIDSRELQSEMDKLYDLARQKWSQLADSDLEGHGGDVDRLVNRIHQKTGEARETIEKFLHTHAMDTRRASTTAHPAEVIADSSQHDVSAHTGGRLTAHAGSSEDAHAPRVPSGSVVRQEPRQFSAAVFVMGVLVGLVVGLAVRSH